MVGSFPEGRVRFFIAGIRRTGTGLIRTTLDDHPDIRCIGEAFNFGHRFGVRRGMKCVEGYRNFLGDVRCGVAQDVLWRGWMTQRYLDWFYHSGSERVVGLKVMQSQLEDFPRVLPYMRKHGMRVIHVVRNNVLKTLVSRAAKRVTGVSHERKRGGVTVVELDVEPLVRRLDRLVGYNERWPVLVEGLPYLCVRYEDFVRDRDRELRRMLEFLGVEVRLDLGSEFVKGNSDDLRKVIGNFDEVAGVLRGTEYEWMLDA